MGGSSEKEMLFRWRWRGRWGGVGFDVVVGSMVENPCGCNLFQKCGPEKMNKFVMRIERGMRNCRGVWG